MATRIIKRNELVGLSSVSFIRAQTVTFAVTDTKPSTRMYAFFDGVDVGRYITPSGGSLGGNIVTDASGKISGTFAIPGGVFNTGDRVFRLQDISTYDITSTPGAVVGSAEGTFSALGMLQTWRETVTTVNSITNFIVIPPPPPARGNGNGGARDPLAQTFFTYGITGGCYITKMDLFFKTKDAAIPVTLEIRETVNGYPGQTLVSEHASVSMTAASVNISVDASAPTVFTFSRPIYLAEDREYCFVLLSNSNSYNAWTSKFGDKSIETGKTIFEQPFIGTMFKSENNITWTAEQTEDIKFTMYKASFTALASDVTLKANAPPMIVLGDWMTVTSGSPVVTLKFKFQHGYRTSDLITLSTVSTGTYRGITNGTITNSSGFSVTVTDDYTLTFNCGANATSTGTLAASGILNKVIVDTAGTGYVAPTITFSAPPSGVTATGTVTVSGGRITGIVITNAGSGYLAAPTYTLSETPPSPALLIPISEAVFTANVNRKYQAAGVIVTNDTPPLTRMTCTLKTASDTYVPGSHATHPINEVAPLEKDAVIVNSVVETTSFGGNASTQVIIHLESDNANVSPLIDVGQIPRLRLHNNMINSEATVSTTELTPTAGTALARYISKITTLETTSKGARVIVNAASITQTSFDVYIRTSVSSSSANHTTGSWVKMNCDVNRSMSSSWSEYKDYEFYLDGIVPFDAYDIKIVLMSSVRYVYPKINNYRAIILAT